MVLAPVVRERKGEYGRLLEEMRQAGLRPRGGRRRAAPPRRGDQARQALQARHLDRRRPPGDEGGGAQAPRRVDRGGLGARRRAGRGRADRGRGRGRRARRSLSGPSAGKRGEVLVFSEKFACLSCGTSMPEIEPRIFSFNSPHGACERCHGLGFQQVIDPDLCVPDPTLSISEGALQSWMGAASMYYRRLLEAVCEAHGIDLDTPWQDLPDADRRDPARRHRRRAPLDLLQEPLRAPAPLHGPLRGDRGRPRAPLREHRLGEDQGADRGADGAAAVPGLRRGAPAAGEPRGHRRRALDRRVHRTSPRAAALEWIGELELTDTERAIANLVVREVAGAAQLPRLGRDRLPDPGAGGDDALRRGGAADPPGDADRLQPGRRPLHPRRALDRPAPARQREADRRRSSGCATSATR